MISLIPATIVFGLALLFLKASLAIDPAAWACIFGGFLLTILACSLMARLGECHTESDNTEVEDLLNRVPNNDLREQLRLKCVRHQLFIKERSQKVVHLFVCLLGASLWMGLLSSLVAGLADHLKNSDYPKGPVLFFLGVFVLAAAALPIVIANLIQNWHRDD